MREVVQLPKASSLSATCACRSALRRAGPISRFLFFAGLEWGACCSPLLSCATRQLLVFSPSIILAAVGESKSVCRKRHNITPPPASIFKV